jgi:hypothetical protein
MHKIKEKYFIRSRRHSSSWQVAQNKKSMHKIKGKYFIRKTQGPGQATPKLTTGSFTV